MARTWIIFLLKIFKVTLRSLGGFLFLFIYFLLFLGVWSLGAQTDHFRQRQRKVLCLIDQTCVILVLVFFLCSFLSLLIFFK